MTARAPASSFASPGFTLIEVLMAMLVLTVGLLGLLQSIQVAYHHNARSRVREEAVLLADEQMNSFKARPFKEITATRVCSPVSKGVAGGTKDFNVTRDCQVLGLEPAADDKCLPSSEKSKMLTVAVTWIFRNETTTHVIYTVKTKGD